MNKNTNRNRNRNRNCVYRILNTPGNKYMKLDLKCSILNFKMEKTTKLKRIIKFKFTLGLVENKLFHKSNFQNRLKQSLPVALPLY